MSIQAINAKFKSGNAVPVERTVVTAVEWLAVQEQIDVLVQEQAEYQVHEAQLTEQLESQARTIRELQEEVEALRTDIADYVQMNTDLLNDREATVSIDDSDAAVKSLYDE